MARIWQKTLKIINERLNETEIFDYFFADTYIYEIVGDLVTVVTKDKTSQRLLSFNYIDLIKEAFNEVTENNCEFKFVLLNEVANSKAPKITNVAAKEEPLFYKNAELKDDLTFDSFVEGEFNKEAYRAASLISKDPGKVFNPLFIYSNSGLGKTHLLHAIGNRIKSKNPKAKILYIDANDFVEEYVKFVKGEKENETLKDFFTGVDVLLFDDVQFLENKVKTE